MPEQVRTFLSVYLAKKSVGNAQSQEVYFTIFFFLLLPWAAHMAKNWKSISEISLRHPLLYLLCGYVVGLYFVIGPDYTTAEFK